MAGGGRVTLLRASRALQVATRDDAIALNRDVLDFSRCAGTVVDRAVADDDVIAYEVDRSGIDRIVVTHPALATKLVANMAREIAARLRHAGQSLHQAAESVIEALAKFGGRGGVVAVDRTGALALPFNTSGMYRGYVRADGAIRTAIWDEPYLLG